MLNFIERLAKIGDKLHVIILQSVEKLPFVHDGKEFSGNFSLFLTIVILLWIALVFKTYKEKRSSESKGTANTYLIKQSKLLFLTISLAIASWLVS